MGIYPGLWECPLNAKAATSKFKWDHLETQEAAD
jgi:hypothetical protein